MSSCMCLLMIVLHVLVNNSGATWGESLEKYPDEAWSKLLTLNVQRVFTLTQKLVPMLEKGHKRDGVGRVINVSHTHILSSNIRSDLSMVSPFLDWKPMHTLLPKPLFTSKLPHITPSAS